MNIIATVDESAQTRRRLLEKELKEQKELMKIRDSKQAIIKDKIAVNPELEARARRRKEEEQRASANNRFALKNILAIKQNMNLPITEMDILKYGNLSGDNPVSVQSGATPEAQLITEKLENKEENENSILEQIQMLLLEVAEPKMAEIITGKIEDAFMYEEQRIIVYQWPKIKTESLSIFKKGVKIDAYIDYLKNTLINTIVFQRIKHQEHQKQV